MTPNTLLTSTRNTPPIGRCHRFLFVAASALLLLAGCGGGTKTAHRSTTTSPIAITTGASSTTVDPTTAAILTAYRAGWTSYLAVAETYPVNPADPRIPQYATDKELASARNQLTLLKFKNHFDQGAVDLHPVVSSVTGATAIVTDCAFDHSVEIDAATNQPTSSADVGHTLFRFTMALVDSTWKTADSTTVKSGEKENACTPALGS